MRDDEDMAGSRSGSRYHWVMLSFSFAIAFLLHLLLFATAPMVTVIMKEMSLSHAEFGFVFSAAMISLILFRVPWGLIGDRIGYLRAFKIALPISAASAVLRAFSSNYLTLLLNQFFLGLGLAAVLPCLPLIVKEWAANRTLGLFDLQISGHTHQGQILPFRIITRFFYPYDGGSFHLANHSHLHVSRGSGTWGPPIRFLAPPEVTVYELIHEDKP